MKYIQTIIVSPHISHTSLSLVLLDLFKPFSARFKENTHAYNESYHLQILSKALNERRNVKEKEEVHKVF